MVFRYIRTGKWSKVLAICLALQLVYQSVGVGNLYALTAGPSQPEFNTFTPIESSNLVNLSSGDFNYNIPLMDIGGYPINLAYNSGITSDQEASWVGLGWNVNVGQINRQVRGIPDDFNGDLMTYENHLRDNITVGVDLGVQFPFFGFDLSKIKIELGKLKAGLKFNNYEGFTLTTGLGASVDIAGTVGFGLDIDKKSAEETLFTPIVNFSSKIQNKKSQISKGLSGSLGGSLPFSTSQGLAGINISSSLSKSYTSERKTESEYSGFVSFNDNLLYTPGDKPSFLNGNFTLNIGLGSEIWGSESPQVHIMGYGSIQSLAKQERNKRVKAYGYEHTENATSASSVLDFNKENETEITSESLSLPSVNQTYDVYSVQGQGISGMFRPYRNQVNYLFDQQSITDEISGSLGFEFGAGTGAHLGFDLEVGKTTAKSGVWDDDLNSVLKHFIIKNQESNQENDYEPVYHKMIGELTTDSGYKDLFEEKLYGDVAMKFGMSGGKFNRRTSGKYQVKNYDKNTNAVSYKEKSVNQVKRKHRLPRVQAVQMLSLGRVNFRKDKMINLEDLPDGIKDHHYIGSKITKPSGEVYVYGNAIYNKKKVETTFALDNKSLSGKNCSSATVTYANKDRSTQNRNGTDHYFNRVQTPAYAHTFLLSSILSSDYQDLTGDGPTDDDLGSYTKITYTKAQDYNWRVPFGRYKASFSEGFRSDHGDDKGHYIYGEKQLKYIQFIETKTHVAWFELSDRKDAIGVEDEDGGAGNGRMKRLDKIVLLAKEQFEPIRSYLENTAYSEIVSSSIYDQMLKDALKVVHFNYSYDLCKNVPNHVDYNENNGTGPGKLTLEKVYFTYGNSNMGKHTPYVFNYKKNHANSNPNYTLRANDVWGNYKPISGGCSVNDPMSNLEFPYVRQDNTDLVNQYVSVWTLKSIGLPSGGELEIETESDRYQFVQNKRAMRMFKIRGVGRNFNNTDGAQLYGPSGESDFIFIDLPKGTTLDAFKNDYLGDIGDTSNKPLYFNFMVNMTSNDFDYVSGYALIDKKATHVIENEGKTIGAIKLIRVKREGGKRKIGKDVNPIAKTAWSFGRKNLNRHVYGVETPVVDKLEDLVSFARSLKNVVSSVIDIFRGPNKKLQKLECARKVKVNKSYIRLYEPDKEKLGGGLRVKKIAFKDNWDVMTGNANTDLSKQYGNTFGQEYIYQLPNGSTSGVATFEPNGSKENPLIQPIFKGKNKLSERGYVEKPMSQSLFPSPEVTYSRVLVRNLPREATDIDGQQIKVEQNATGRTIYEYYTSKDFPVIYDYTDVTALPDVTGPLGSLLKLATNSQLAMSQGFVLKTNDMNGKPKSIITQAENQKADAYISSEYYHYSIDTKGALDNRVDVINENGTISEKVLGVTYDMVNLFTKKESETDLYGVNFNLANLLVIIGVIPVPFPLPVYKNHKSGLKYTTTTKVVHTTGILKEKTVSNLNTIIKTKNLLRDSQSGNVVLTETNDEFDDKYYQLNYLANWYYKSMGLQSNNIGLSGVLKHLSGVKYEVSHPMSGKIIEGNSGVVEGDQIVLPTENDGAFSNQTTNFWSDSGSVFWVIEKNSDGSIVLMDRDGNLVNSQLDDTPFVVYQSGYRNLVSHSMASVTLQANPIVIGSGGDRKIISASDWAEYKVINASAIEYSDLWNSQCEWRLPDPSFVLNQDQTGLNQDLSAIGFNPYLFNVKGNWRVVRSYSYLTSRNNGKANFHPRNEGFYTSFIPFYRLTDSKWEKTPNYNDYWTFTDEVTQFSPYGVEIENRDALNRYSSAQYGHEYSLPTAISNNSAYSQMGYDGFEDYGFEGSGISELVNPHFGFHDQVFKHNESTTNDAYLGVVSNQSHTGKHSLWVKGGHKAEFRIRYQDCDEISCGKLPALPYRKILGLPFDVVKTIPLMPENYPYSPDCITKVELVEPFPCGNLIINKKGTANDFSDDVIELSNNESCNVNTITYRICNKNGECITGIIVIDYHKEG